MSILLCGICGKEISDEEYVVNWGSCGDCFDKEVQQYLEEREKSMGLVNKDNVREVFTYHQPSPDQVERMEVIRDAAIGLAQAILTHCPDSADKSAALRKVREARMDANACIVLNGMI